MIPFNETYTYILKDALLKMCLFVIITIGLPSFVFNFVKFASIFFFMGWCEELQFFSL